MTKPDFFILGAPKCGTTALNEYLKRHPEVFVPDAKEIHFFGSDLRFDHHRPTREEYLGLFEGAENFKRAGEASVWYLYSEEAAKEIAAFNPDARVIAMLRDPVDMLPSLHNQLLYNGNEDLADFAEALAAEPDRAAGRRLPPRPHWQAMHFGRTVQYARQLQRYYDVLGRDRVHVILYDDFKNDTAGCYRRVLEFLEVDPDFTTTFEVINPSKQVRSRTFKKVVDFLRGNPLWRLLPERVHKRLFRKATQINTQYVQREKLSPQLRRQLAERFRPEAEALATLLGRDLGHWCQAEKKREA